jgi:hypothetical protein
LAAFQNESGSSFAIHQAVAIGVEWPAGAWLGTRRAKDRIEGFFQKARPLNDWLQTNVGPSV